MPEPVPPPAPRWVDHPRPTGSGAVDQSIALWRTLAALGVQHVVLAPGSRSAPLVYALEDPQQDAELQAHVRIDERAAAFTALGLSRRDPEHPAAVVTTSGTATAHLHAAVMEAHHSRIPLLVITADRPAELRETGANQTTRQVGMFPGLTRWSVDLPAPTAGRAEDRELRTLVSTAARAVALARGPHPGPVHLNLGLRDPLVPTPHRAPHPGEDPPGRTPLTVRSVTRSPAPDAVRIARGTVVVAGDGAGRAARDFAQQHTLPLLAEPSSGARGGPMIVPGYPELLREVMAAAQHPLRPRRAVVFGRPTLSRAVVGALLGAEDVEVTVVDPHPDWPDAARAAHRVVPAAQGVPDPAEDPAGRAEEVESWQREGRRRLEGAAPAPWQRRAALAVWDATGAEDLLVLGSSSLIRDLEQHAPAARTTVIAGRGVAGIDGTTSFAGGISLARAPAGTVRVLCGDLTAVHDLTGLVIGPEERVPDLQVIVVDDGGGRIFSSLEHAAAPPALLRRFFTTPHGTDLAAAAQALGAHARRIGVAELPAAMDDGRRGVRVLVVQEDPSETSRPSG